MTEPAWDVIVAGAGNAGMCAAHAARERGRRVLVLEKADEAWSGGNSAFTAGAIRLAHGGLDDLRDLVEGVDDELAATTDLDPYTEDDFLADMRRVTLGRGDEAMARILVGDSAGVVRWLRDKGLRFRLMYERQANEVNGRRRFWGGLAVGIVDGGEGLMAQHRAAAARDGIELRHDTAVEDLLRGDDGAITGVAVRHADGTRESCAPARSCSPRAASRPTRRCARPTSGRTGTWRRCAARPTTPARCCARRSRTAPRPYGHWSGCHAIQWDAGAPPTGDRELTNRYSRQSYPVAIVVNARRASASSTRAPTSATTPTPSTAPRCCASRRASPRRSSTPAPCRCCARSTTRRPAPRAWTPTRWASSPRASASTPTRLERTVAEYNAAIADGDFDPTIKDGKRTEGIEPPKSNWALPVEQPPFTAFPITCGITFTFGGVRVDEDARVLDVAGRPLPGLFAAGELVGGLFYHNYPGGTGLTAGAVYGRRAGYSAAG